MDWETSQCRAPEVTRRGMLYRYGNWRRYIERCLPVGEVTRRCLRAQAYPDYSSTRSMEVQRLLQAKYHKESNNWGLLARRVLAIILRSSPILIIASVLVAPNPRLKSLRYPTAEFSILLRHIPRRVKATRRVEPQSKVVTSHRLRLLEWKRQ